MSNYPDFWQSNLTRPLDLFFEDLVTSPLYRKGGNHVESAKNAFNSKCEVQEDKENYHMRFDLPGIPKDQIKIEVHENRLSISGERKEEKKEENKKLHFSEIHYGSFTRSFTFPTPVDAEKVHAQFEKGVLIINIPKMESNKARQIQIR